MRRGQERIGDRMMRLYWTDAQVTLVERIAKKYQSGKLIQWEKAFAEHPEWLRALRHLPIRTIAQYYSGLKRRRRFTKEQKQARSTAAIEWRNKHRGRFIKNDQLPASTEKQLQSLRRRFGLSRKISIILGVRMLHDSDESVLRELSKG